MIHLRLGVYVLIVVITNFLQEEYCNDYTLRLRDLQDLET